MVAQIKGVYPVAVLEVPRNRTEVFIAAEQTVQQDHWRSIAEDSFVQWYGVVGHFRSL